MHQRRSACRWTSALLAVLVASPALAQGLAGASERERQRREALKQAPGGPTSFLGAWNGVEDEGSSHRYPTVTFFKDGGTIAYETPNGTTALRLESVRFDGVTVRFLVAGVGGPRFYAGSLSGESISGKISGDEPGRISLGSFRLTRGAPSVLGAPADGPSSRMSLAAAQAYPSDRQPSQAGGPSVAIPSGSSGSSSSLPTTDTEMRRQAGEQQLASTLGSLASQAARLVSLVQQFQAGKCGGGLCEEIYNEIGRLVIAVGRGLERAEEDARQNNVLPGRVRELRAQYRLDNRVWDELSSLVTKLEREYRAKKR